MNNKILEHLADGETQDRIERTYSWIDKIVAMHGQPKKKDIGGGFYDMDEEFENYVEEHQREYTPLQWVPIVSYFEVKKKQKQGK
ncbi:MAG TPA: hypothetical protein PLK34_00040 [Candidatus Pacearchaeota archaeon]|nr:hypothetical protein [Candidatus Pacearchaeota archaeon]